MSNELGWDDVERMIRGSDTGDWTFFRDDAGLHAWLPGGVTLLVVRIYDDVTGKPYLRSIVSGSASGTTEMVAATLEIIGMVNAMACEFDGMCAPTCGLDVLDEMLFGSNPSEGSVVLHKDTLAKLIEGWGNRWQPRAEKPYTRWDFQGMLAGPKGETARDVWVAAGTIPKDRVAFRRKEPEGLI